MEHCSKISIAFVSIFLTINLILLIWHSNTIANLRLQNNMQCTITTKTRPTTAPSSVNLFRPWKCALLSPRIAGRWGIRPFAYHRLCKYTCVHTRASHNPLDYPCRFYTTQNRSWLLYLKSKGRIINSSCQQTFENKKFVDITQQCFASLPQVNFPANNLNFHWRCRRWNGIQATF